MTELGLVLLALYLIEGLGWVSLRGIAISRRPWGGFGVRFPKRVRSHGSRGLLLPEPWIPAGERYVIHPWPLALSPDGVVAAEDESRPVASGSRPATAVGWAEVESLRVRGSALQLGETTVRAGTAADAASFARLLRRLARTPEARREAAIREALAASFDDRRARNRARIMRVMLRDARVLAFATTFNMLLVGPVATQFLGSARVWKAWLLLHLVLTVLTCVFVREATRRKPRFAAEDRLQSLILPLLYPPATARFIEHLFPNAFSGFDPLAVQAVLVDRKRLVRIAHDRRRALHPASGEHEIRRWFRNRVLEEVESLIERRALAETARTTPEETEAAAHCPRCGARYRVLATHCADCPGVALVRSGSRDRL